MLILGLLGMYFDAVVAEVKTFLLLFRYALAILCNSSSMLFLFQNWKLFAPSFLLWSFPQKNVPNHYPQLFNVMHQIKTSVRFILLEIWKLFAPSF